MKHVPNTFARLLSSALSRTLNNPSSQELGNATRRKAFASLLMLLFGCLALPLQAQEPIWLDISIRPFTPAPVVEAAGNAMTSISQGVREAEGRFLAVHLRHRLEAGQHFGAVRVMPLAEQAADLVIEGQVLVSDGRQLALSIEAIDRSGRIWLQESFTAEAVSSVSLSGSALAEDDFAALFERIAGRLESQLAVLDLAEIRALRQLSLLRYGHALVPAAFEAYFSQEIEEAPLTVTRLPAEDDPMLQRIQSIREHEYLFIDVVDEQLRQFYQDIQPVYTLWREFQREQQQSAESFVNRRRQQGNTYPAGSYYDLRENYHNYRWARVSAQYQDQLNEGFANEIEDTEIALEDSLFKLTGTLEQQYREWHSILAELFVLENQAP